MDIIALSKQRNPSFVLAVHLRVFFSITYLQLPKWGVLYSCSGCSGEGKDIAFPEVNNVTDFDCIVATRE